MVRFKHLGVKLRRSSPNMDQIIFADEPQHRVWAVLTYNSLASIKRQ
jgi:hypothetical protein